MTEIHEAVKRAMADAQREPILLSGAPVPVYYLGDQRCEAQYVRPMSFDERNAATAAAAIRVCRERLEELRPRLHHIDEDLVLGYERALDDMNEALQ